MANKNHEHMIERDKFIVKKAKDFTVCEIQLLLERNGFQKLGRTRIYQILEENGISPVRKNNLKN